MSAFEGADANPFLEPRGFGAMHVGLDYGRRQGCCRTLAGGQGLGQAAYRIMAVSMTAPGPGFKTPLFFDAMALRCDRALFQLAGLDGASSFRANTVSSLK